MQELREPVVEARGLRRDQRARRGVRAVAPERRHDRHEHGRRIRDRGEGRARGGERVVDGAVAQEPRERRHLGARERPPRRATPATRASWITSGVHCARTVRVRAPAIETVVAGPIAAAVARARRRSPARVIAARPALEDVVAGPIAAAAGASCVASSVADQVAIQRDRLVEARHVGRLVAVALAVVVDELLLVRARERGLVDRRRERRARRRDRADHRGPRLLEVDERVAVPRAIRRERAVVRDPQRDAVGERGLAPALERARHRQRVPHDPDHVERHRRRAPERQRQQHARILQQRRPAAHALAQQPIARRRVRVGPAQLGWRRQPVAAAVREHRLVEAHDVEHLVVAARVVPVAHRLARRRHARGGEHAGEAARAAAVHAEHDEGRGRIHAPTVEQLTPRRRSSARAASRRRSRAAGGARARRSRRCAARRGTRTAARPRPCAPASATGART